MKKRIVISTLLLVLVFGILCAGIILIRKNTEKEAKEQTVEQVKEQEKIRENEEAKKEDASLENIVFENMNLLENYFSGEKIKSLEEQAENFLRQDEAFASTKKLTCTDEIYETQSQIPFYFTTEDGSVLFSTYHKEDKGNNVDSIDEIIEVQNVEFNIGNRIATENDFALRSPFAILFG